MHTSVKHECLECYNVFHILSEKAEDIGYCPFCGTGQVVYVYSNSAVGDWIKEDAQ